MKKKYKKHFEPEIHYIQNKEVIKNYLKTPLSSKTRPFLINSITRITSENKNDRKYINTEEAKNINYFTISKNPTQTPKIKTRYDSIIKRLNTNILSLKGEYKNILKNNDDIKNRINFLEKRNLVGEVRANEGILKKKIKQYKNIKKNEQNKEKEKNMKMKEEYNKNKIIQLNIKKVEVGKMREKEINNLKKMRNKKIKIKEEEKQSIKEKLSQQKDRYKKEIELRKKINREKEIKNAERLDGYRVYVLRKIENELRNKVKIEISLNNELSKQYYQNFDNI